MLHSVSPGNSPNAFFEIDPNTGAIDKVDSSNHAPDRIVQVEATYDGVSQISNEIILRNENHNPPE
ncbi:MAG: hypothetical protein U5K81_02040 [Trueperaceae bacterium]|nr:hypothetical protein [Trueperaceae bacterium]